MEPVLQSRSPYSYASTPSTTSDWFSIIAVGFLFGTKSGEHGTCLTVGYYGIALTSWQLPKETQMAQTSFHKLILHI